jgi:hypothetical protein
MVYVISWRQSSRVQLQIQPSLVTDREKYEVWWKQRSNISCLMLLCTNMHPSSVSEEVRDINWLPLHGRDPRPMFWLVIEVTYTTHGFLLSRIDMGRVLCLSNIHENRFLYLPTQYLRLFTSSEFCIVLKITSSSSFYQGLCPLPCSDSRSHGIHTTH